MSDSSTIIEHEQLARGEEERFEERRKAHLEKLNRFSPAFNQLMEASGRYSASLRVVSDSQNRSELIDACATGIKGLYTALGKEGEAERIDCLRGTTPAETEASKLLRMGKGEQREIVDKIIAIERCRRNFVLEVWDSLISILRMAVLPFGDLRFPNNTSTSTPEQPTDSDANELAEGRADSLAKEGTDLPPETSPLAPFRP